MKKILSIILVLTMIASLFVNTGVVFATDSTIVATIGEVEYTTLADAIAAVKDGETIQLADNVTLEEGTIKLPATIKNVTIKGGANSVLKNMAIHSADGNSIDYQGLTFDGITFDGSRIVLTGWRTGEVIYKDMTVTNCTFKNIDDTTNNAPVHINCDADEAVENFTFTNNVIDGATGGSKSGLYLQATGEIKVANNVINNVSFRPYVIQVTSDDGIADNFVVTGNTFSGSAAGRAQGLSNNSEGTDTVNVVVSNNIFKDITNAQQICYWNFNAEKTTVDISKNYYDIDITANPDRIYFNSAAQSAEDLVEMGVYPIYTELNDNGTINTESEFTYKGEGTAESPYLINNLDDLKWFRDDVNAGNNYKDKYVKLTADIDLSSVTNWTPIGNVTYNSKYVLEATNVFSGVFDGNDNVIFNLKVNKTVGGADTQANVGLFGITGAGAVIKDLTLTNVDINTDGRNVGALAGFAYNTDLENITVNGNIQIKGGNNVSGVSGMTRNHDMIAKNITVKGNDGSTIVGNNIVGGIFAEIAPNGSTQTFTNLSVENVAITGVGGVGGIVGLMTNSAVDTISVKNVVLTGKTEYQGNAMGRIRLGSVVGLMGGKTATIENATVENVTAKNLDGSAVVLPIIGANYDASSNETEAKIGDVYYNTFASAYAAAKDGDTITLLAPIEVAKDETLTLNKNVTITLVTDNDAVTSLILNKGNLIVDGDVKLSYKYTGTNSGDAYNTIESAPGSVLTVKGGTIENLSENCLIAYAIDGLTNTDASNVEVNIEGGVITSKKIAVRIFANSVLGTGYLNISGGEIFGRVIIQNANAKANKAELSITGGTFNTNGYKSDVLYVGGSSGATGAIIANVSGGTFKGEILSTITEGFIIGGTFSSDVSDFCADGFTCEQNADGTYGIIVDETVWVTKGASIKNLKPAVDGKIRIMLLVGIDSLDYKAGGFEVSVDGSPVRKIDMGDTVWTSVNIHQTDGKTVPLTAADFGEDCKYIMYITLSFDETKYENLDLTYRAYLTDFEGNTKYSARTFETQITHEAITAQ